MELVSKLLGYFGRITSAGLSSRLGYSSPAFKEDEGLWSDGRQGTVAVAGAVVCGRLVSTARGGGLDTNLKPVQASWSDYSDHLRGEKSSYRGRCGFSSEPRRHRGCTDCLPASPRCCSAGPFLVGRKELTADARELKGELYCLPCHDKMGVPICGACRRPIEGRVVNAMGKQWHVEVSSPRSGDRGPRTPDAQVRWRGWEMLRGTCGPRGRLRT